MPLAIFVTMVAKDRVGNEAMGSKRYVELDGKASVGAGILHVNADHAWDDLTHHDNGRWIWCNGGFEVDLTLAYRFDFGWRPWIADLLRDASAVLSVPNIPMNSGEYPALQALPRIIITGSDNEPTLRRD